MSEIEALDYLVKLGKGVVTISLTENGLVGIYWDGREGCSVSDDTLMQCLKGRYFQNETWRIARKEKEPTC